MNRWCKTIGQWRSFTVLVLLGLSMVPLAAGTVTAQGGKPSLEIVSPAGGAVVQTNDVFVEVKASNFTIDCAKAGMADEPASGHIHVMIDGMTMAQLANLYCLEQFVVPLDGLEPGKHTLIVDLATHTHLDLMETAKEVEIDYQPIRSQPLPPATDQGVPGLELVSPSNGATVPPKFTVQVKPVNFLVSEDLEGKANVPGYGHWHVFVDTTDPMALMEEAMAAMEQDMAGTPAGGDMAHMAMPMPAMVLMPGSNAFELDLTAWGPGEHTIFIEPAQNDHTHLQEFKPLVFTVVVEETAS